MTCTFSFASGDKGIPRQVINVSLSRGTQDSSPSLDVTWNRVGGVGVTYNVCLSASFGTKFAPPSNADCVGGITDNFATRGPLSSNMTYFVWVAASNMAGDGDYSYRQALSTYCSEWDQAMIAIDTVKPLFNNIFCNNSTSLLMYTNNVTSCGHNCIHMHSICYWL